MSLNVKLIVVGGDVKTTEITLRLPATIGRGKGQSVVLPHPLVSRQHCQLFESEGHLVVRDLGSLNGTFVNNQKIEESPLPPGELLTVGTVTFRAVYDAEATEGSIETVKKPAPNDKTLPASKAPTIRAASKQPAPAAASDSEVLEFNVVESDIPIKPDASPQHPTERLKQTVVEDNRSTKPAAKGAKSANKQQPPEDEEFDARLPGEEDDEEEASNSSDDDLNDFLQNLK